MNYNTNNKKAVKNLLAEYEKGELTEAKLLGKLFLQFNEASIENLLASLFTKKEMSTLAHRLLIIKMLKLNIFQHEISRKLKVGVTTVSRGAHAIENGKFDFM